MSKLAILQECEDHTRPMGATSCQPVIEFPMQITDESAHEYMTPKRKQAMRRFVDHWLAGQWYATDGSALVALLPHAEDSLGRGIEGNELLLLGRVVRDYRIAQDVAAKHLPGRMFER